MAGRVKRFLRQPVGRAPSRYPPCGAEATLPEPRRAGTQFCRVRFEALPTPSAQSPPPDTARPTPAPSLRPVIFQGASISN